MCLQQLSGIQLSIFLGFVTWHTAAILKIVAFRWGSSMFNCTPGAINLFLLGILRGATALPRPHTDVQSAAVRIVASYFRVS